ncbi:MAG: hypothetical protein WBD47_08650 [Phormidesmis sp.]
MVKLFSNAIGATAQRVAQVWSSLQLQKLVAIAFVGLFLLTTSVDNANLKASTKAELNDLAARGANGRPTTTGQWLSENEELQGQPGQQAERILKESADAVGEMAEIYPGNVKSVLPGMSNDSIERDD